MRSGRMRGLYRAQTDPSSVCAASQRIHLLPQGEKRARRHRRPFAFHADSRILTFARQSACLAATQRTPPGSNARKNRHVLCAGHRSGHHILARDRVSQRHFHRRHGAAGIPAAFSGLGLGRARAGGHLDLDGHGLPRGAGEGQASRPRTSPRSASPTSARPPWCGTAPPAQAVHRAIVWQDRRTADICAKLKAEGHEPAISAKTGLIIDPYFSGTKVAWILDHVPGARARAERGELLFGTVDCYLLVAADRRQGARDRRHQRLAHAAVQHPQRRVGRRAAEHPARAALDAPGGEGFLRTRSATACPSCSAARSRSRASPATSRPRPSDRPASRPA